jgi:hypothetical protein
VVIEDLLQRHLAMQLRVECDEHSSDASLGVGSEHPEALAVRCRGAGPVGDRDTGIIILDRRFLAEVGQRSLDVLIAEAGEARTTRTVDMDRRQAFLEIVAMLLNVPRDEEFHGGPITGAEVPSADEMIGHRPGLVVRPGLKGSDELPLVDQAVLKREHPEEKVSR